MGYVIFVLMDFFVCFSGVIYVKCDVIISSVEFVFIYVLVVGQFNYCFFGFWVVVNKRQ